MNLLIIEQFHDYEQKCFLADSTLLDSTNPVDALVIKAIKAKKNDVRVEYMPRAVGDDSGNPTISKAARLKLALPTTIDKVVWLHINFDC